MEIADARLYFITDPIPEERLDAALAGGVDVLQLRMKDASDDAIVEAAAVFRRLCDSHRALFVLNDRPDLVERCRADGVHVGQEDASVVDARRAVGARIVGLSTHAPAQLEAAGGADYVAVGPVFATPTKPGRAAAGLDYVRYAAAHADVPWFAIGGIDLDNARDVVAAGATRLAVVRAIRDTDDPRGAAQALRALIDT